MPSRSINAQGVGQFFADVLGASPNYKSMADAYATRRRIENDTLTSKAQASRLDAQTAQTQAELAFEEKQRAAAGEYGTALGDFFADRYKNQPEYLPAGVAGPPAPTTYVSPEQEAMLRTMSTSYANSIPGANPDQVSAGNLRTLGMGDMLFSSDPDRQRVGAVAATGKYQGKDDVMLPGDREAIYGQETAINDADNLAKIMGIEAREFARVAAEGGSPDDAGFGGTGESNTNMRIIQTALNGVANGLTVSQAQRDQVMLAFNREYGPRREVRNVDGQQQVVEIQPEIPANVQALMAKLGSSGEATAATPTPPVDAGAGAVSSPVSASAPASPNDLISTPPSIEAPVEQAGNVTNPAPGVTITSVGDPAPKSLTEAEAKNKMFYSTMGRAHRGLTTMGRSPMSFPGQKALLRGEAGGENQSLVNHIMQDVARGLASPEQHQFLAHFENFLNPVLRKDSGAAVPASEYPKYEARFIPQFGDDDETIQLKTVYRELYIAALEKQLATVAAAKGTGDEMALTKAAYDNVSADFLSVAPTAEAIAAIEQKYGITSGVSGAEIPVINTPDEARQLPPGTQFRTPDGRLMKTPGA